MGNLNLLKKAEIIAGGFIHHVCCSKIDYFSKS